MSTINDSDLLLVERNGNLHQITYDQMSTLNDDDILLVERGGVQYKVEAQYVSTGPNGVILPSVEVLTPVNGAGLNDGQSYTPISSAYVSTDTTPIYHRNFPERITTISGGSWVNENSIFNGSTDPYAELQGATGVVSQVVFTPHAGWFEGDTYIWAYASGGGTIDILDDADTVLRTYTLLTSSGGNTAVGIVRADQKIRFTTSNQNESLYIANINRGPIDSEFTGRVAFEFTDDTDLDKMVAPIIQTDENGNVKVPTTSTVDSTTTIPGDDKFSSQDYTGNGNTRIYNQTSGVAAPPVGDRMVWGKVDGTGTGFISDNVALYSKFLLTAEGAHEQAYFGPELDVDETRYPSGNTYCNVYGKSNYFAEIGVAPKVLDIVSYTGNGEPVRTIPHNLGCQPGMIIIKNLTTAYHWQVWHKDLIKGKIVNLNLNNASRNSNRFPSQPTRDKFYVDSHGRVNGNGDRYVAYVFAADTPGKIKCGIYDGSYSNISIYTGFKSGFFLTKARDQDWDWSATTKHASGQLKRWSPSTQSGLDGNGSYYIGFNSNSYVNLYGSSIGYNTANQKYIYLAISEDVTGPNSTQLNLLGGQDLEYFNDGTEITSNLAASGSRISFGSMTWSGNSTTRNMSPYVGGSSYFNISYATANKWLVWTKAYDGPYGHSLYDSERGFMTLLRSDTTDAELYSSDTLLEPVGTGSYKIGSSAYLNLSNVNYIAWNFLASPEFFDVQKYYGNGNYQTIKHDLGVEPGFIIIRNTGGLDWQCYHHNLGFDQNMELNSTGGSIARANRVTATTDQDFTVGPSSPVNSATNSYISYIFAKDTPYVKCGTYSGSGAGQQVNVGFKPRWMLIKRTDSNGNWVILDKNRSNKYLVADESWSQLSMNWNFYSSGVTLLDSVGNVNIPGAGYVYVAIADESLGHPPNFPSSATVKGTPDVNAATMVVNAESFDVGDSASAAPLEASITSVAGSEGNKLFVDSSTGTWIPGLYAKGSETTIDAPGPDEITFTSQNQGTPAFSGVDATLASRTWTLESGTTATGPWTLVDSYVDYDVLNSQTGATPWSSNKPSLTPNTFYRVKVQYNSTNAESVESVYNTFKTGDA